MPHLSFVLTILFMLLGPLKLIPIFAGITRDVDENFRRALAIWATLIASAVVTFLVLAGADLLGKYHISVDALRIGGGIVLLLSALGMMFPCGSPSLAVPSGATPVQVAVSPLVTPTIIPPAGVAAILLFMMLAPAVPGMTRAVVISLSIIMFLDFLAMYFNRTIMKVPGLRMVLQLLGAVLVFLQVALAVEIMLNGVLHLATVLRAGA